MGGIILAASAEPQSIGAWSRGAEGERRLGRQLDDLRSRDVRVLHDRAIPRSRANIDHLVISPTGVYVVDSKRYRGRIEHRAAGTIFRPGPDRLFVGQRDRSRLVSGMARQVETVRSVLDRCAPDAPTPVHAVLCFVDGDWAPFARPFTIDGVLVLWPKKLRRRIVQPGPLTADQIERIGALLAEELTQA